MYTNFSTVTNGSSYGTMYVSVIGVDILTSDSFSQGSSHKFRSDVSVFSEKKTIVRFIIHSFKLYIKAEGRFI